jgi:hypothetical protein
MSDAHTDDPVLAHLRERKATLEGVAADTMARLAEIDALLATFADGRTRVRRRLKEIPAPDRTCAPDTGEGP